MKKEQIRVGSLVQIISTKTSMLKKTDIGKIIKVLSIDSTGGRKYIASSDPPLANYGGLWFKNVKKVEKFKLLKKKDLNSINKLINSFDELI